MNAIALLTATLLAANPIPMTRTDTGNLAGYNRGDAMIVTSDGHLWGVRDDLPMEGNVIVTFATCGTSDVTDDIILSVTLAD